MLHTKSEHETARILYAAVAVSGLQPHKYNPIWCLSALQIIYSEKNFRSAMSRFLHLISVFIPMISFTVWAEFMTQFLYGEENLSVFQHENMETAGAINRNVNSRGIHLFS